MTAPLRVRIGPARLRAAPGLSASILTTLPVGTTVYDLGAPLVSSDGHRWRRVAIAVGYIADELIEEIEMATDWGQRAREIAKQHGIDPELFYRQIKQESNFNPSAFNAKSGATGIAQIIPRWHPGVNPRDPEASLQYAAKWIASMLKSGLTYARALASYNWGPANVATWDGRRETLPAETRTYLDTILGPGWASGSGGGSVPGGGITLPGGIQIPQLPSLPTADTFAQLIWDTFNGLRQKIRDAVVANARNLAVSVGGPVVFWIVGQTLISIGLLGLALAGLGAVIKSKPGHAATAVGSRFGPAPVKAGLSVVGAVV